MATLGTMYGYLFEWVKIPISGAEQLLSPHIFKANDIRGIVDETLTEDAVRQIGHALGTLAHEAGVATMVLGRDGRLSGERLLRALSVGIVLAGIDVIDIGMVPTPTVYFATQYFETGSGVAVTGSHNPPQYNGLKMMLAGATLNSGEITDLRERILSGRLHTAAVAGHIRTENILPAYIDAIAHDVQLARPMTVAIDCGNGVGGVAAVEVFCRLGCTVVDLFCDVNGNFPNHHPDPADEKNLVDLQKALRDTNAEIGLAFDGDADRLGVVTKTGNIIYPDRQIMLFVEDVLADQPGAPIVFDVKCSAHLATLIERHGGVPVMWKTGHSFMKAKIKETGAPFGGEMSGHLFFNDRWGGFDDGLYSGARLLEVLSKLADVHAITDKLNQLPQAVSTPELHIPVAEGENRQLIEQFERRANFNGATINTIDGVRADYADGFGLARASNTTPVIVLRFEADDEVALMRIQNDFRDVFLAIKPDAKLPF
jgi:phosphomannomutase/phosphoglucomutase